MKKLIILSALFLFSGITFGQSLQKGGVVAIHEWTLKLKADITMNQFLDHWGETIVPEMEKLIPEMKALTLKGVQKDNNYEYAGLYYYNSLEDLRKYWKEDGSPTEDGAAIMEKFVPLLEELSKFGEFTWSPSDWVIL
jgi:hypothetical protein